MADMPGRDEATTGDEITTPGATGASGAAGAAGAAGTAAAADSGPGGAETPEGTGGGAVEGGTARGGRRMWPWVVGGAVVLLGAGAAIAFNVILGGGGPQPAAAFPASTDAYMRFDFDPSPGQKLAAMELAGRFPALEEVADDIDGDLKRALYDLIAEQSPDFADAVDYEDDLEPWLGNRVGFGVILDDPDEPVGFGAIQVTDRDAAAEALPRILGEDAADLPGFAFTSDYVVIAEDQDTADRIVAEAEQAPLAESERFTEVHDLLGDPGVMSLWADVEPDQLAELDLDEGDGATAAPASLSTAGQAATAEEVGRVTFAAALRLADRHVELVGVALPEPSDLPADIGGTIGSDLDPAVTIGRLPASTLFAFSMGGIDFTEAQRDELWDQATGGAPEGFDTDQFADDLEGDLGISLPDDLFDLLSNDITVSVDTAALGLTEDFDFAAEGFPAAIVFDTSGAEGRAAVDKLVDLIEQSGIGLSVDATESTVVVAASDAYLTDITGSGAEQLSDTGGAERAVGTEPVFMAMYSGIEALVPELRPGGSMEGTVPDEVLENLEVLEGVGFTASAATDEGGDPVGHFVFRVTLVEEG